MRIVCRLSRCTASVFLGERDGKNAGVLERTHLEASKVVLGMRIIIRHEVQCRRQSPPLNFGVYAERQD